MPIYQRKSGVWYIDIRAPSGSRIRQSTGTQNKQEAQRLHDKLKHDLWQQEKLDQKPLRLWEEAALRWLHEKQEKKSIQSDIYRLRGLSMFKGIYLHNLTRDLVMHSIAKTMQGKANATKNRYLALVRAILNKAANEWLWIESPYTANPNAASAGSRLPKPKGSSLRCPNTWQAWQHLVLPQDYGKATLSICAGNS